MHICISVCTCTHRHIVTYMDTYAQSYIHTSTTYYVHAHAYAYPDIYVYIHIHVNKLILTTYITP